MRCISAKIHFLIFAEACMFWEDSILAALKPLNLCISPSARQRYHFKSQSWQIVGRENSYSSTSIIPHTPLVSTHAHVHKTHTHTGYLCCSRGVWSFQHDFTQGSVVEASKGHKGRNGCCHACLKIFDPIHMCLNIYTQPLACGKLAFKREPRRRNQPGRSGNSLSCALSVPYFPETIKQD